MSLPLFATVALFALASSPVPSARAPAAPVAVVAQSAVSPGGLSESGFQAWLPQLRAEAARAGISRTTLDNVFPALTFSARTVELDRSQPGGPPGSSGTPSFAPYRNRHLSRPLIDRGRSRYIALAPRLSEISRRYGVPPSLLIAIWGKETSYGSITGNFDLLNSLASLAYEGRRRRLFTDEFIATLRMLERGFPRSRLVGSWAGATGYPQFLPSVYLRLGVDGDGDGRADIWRSELDALASIANYLKYSGWRPGLAWGSAVRVPPGFDRNAVRSRLRADRCARVHERHSRWLTAGEWRRLGIVSALPDQAMATLIEPDGPGATAYLTTTNFRAILDYNCSNFYALTVGLLADSVDG